MNKIVDTINASSESIIPGGEATLAASAEPDGTIRIELITDCRVTEAVGDIIARGIAGLPLRQVREDESANVAWFEVVSPE